MSDPWFKENDPFTKVGLARLIVVRHKHEYGFSGEKKNCIQIMHTETFEYGFLCKDISESRYGSGPHRWLDEELHNSEHKINHLFKDSSIGIYELTGEIYHWSSQSYEGEWDGDSELRNSSIREISFDHAVQVCNDNWMDDMVALLPRGQNHEGNYNESTDIHHYMTYQQILRHQANALSRIIEGDNYYGYNKPCYRDSTSSQLETLIHMLMLQIDSDKQNMQPKALAIDVMVQDVIKQHRILMDPEY